MINNFYSSVSNGNVITTCLNTQHHVQEPLYLLRNNFLSEFRTSLEKAKVRANLGIADSETLYWGNIQGNIEDQTDIAGHINTLLSFDYDAEKGFNAGEDFENIHNVREAAITCLDYLSKYKGEGAEIAALEEKVRLILQNLYAVDTIEEAAASEGGVINEIITNLQDLDERLKSTDSTVEDIETLLNKVEENVESINESLKNINSLIRKYEPEDGTQNALEIIEDIYEDERKPVLDEFGDPVYDDNGLQLFEDLKLIKAGGLYVKDLLPLIDELSDKINGNADEISILLEKVSENTGNITENALEIETIKSETIPGITEAILNVAKQADEKFITKESLGTTSPIITEDKLTNKLKGYVEINSTASLKGITSQLDSINIHKPFNPDMNQPLDLRRYVQTRSDLLSVKAWDGMEVIVIDSAMMYICTDASKSSLDTYEAWKSADSLRIEVVSWDRFNLLKKEGRLNEDIYYYIHDEDVKYTAVPDKENFIIRLEEVEKDGKTVYEKVYDEEAYAKALDNYNHDMNILHGLYLSAVWAEEINTRLQYKASTAEVQAINTRIDNLDKFFTDSTGGSLSDILQSIYNIYKPAETVEGATVPASGLVVGLRDDVDELREDVDGLLEKDFVTWDEIGKGNEIATKSDLTSELSNYVLKNSTAQLYGLTSKEENGVKEKTIKLESPFEPTFQGPIDSRHYVEQFADLFTIPSTTAYKGMEVIVKLDAMIYMLNDADKITSQEGWTAIGSASIINLTMEEYLLRYDNTNEDGSSKGHKYESGEYKDQDIPTLLDGTYYFIKEGPITRVLAPVEEDYTHDGVFDLEGYQAAVQEYLDSVKVLCGQYMSASWGTLMDSVIRTKASLTDIDNVNLTISALATNANLELAKTRIKDLEDTVATLNRYFEGNSDGESFNVKTAIRNLDDAIKVIYNETANTGILVTAQTDIADIKKALYGDNETLSTFVSWEDLGASSTEREELKDGKTLFVKTSAYETDRTNDANKFTTKELDLDGTVSIKPTSDNRVTLNGQNVALFDDIPKTLEFDSYTDYETWRASEEYNTWKADKNLEEWYFLIKNKDGVLPTKAEGETEEAYNTRLLAAKKNMLVTYYDMELEYATKSELSDTSGTLSQAILDAKQYVKNNYEDKINVNSAAITALQTTVADHTTTLSAIPTDISGRVIALREELKTAWDAYYSDSQGFSKLTDIVENMRQIITTSVELSSNLLIASTINTKMNQDLFNLIWAGYYLTVNTGQGEGIEYQSLGTILNRIRNDKDDTLSLTNLNTAILARETIEENNAKLASLREDLTLYTNDTTQSVRDEAYAQAIKDFSNAESVTYLKLGELKDRGELVPGRYYKITDYKTTTLLSNTQVIWHLFYVIVRADDAYTINEKAYAAKPEVNSLDYDKYWENCKLDAWELKYYYDNDTDKFGWADNRYEVREAFSSYRVGDLVLYDNYVGLNSSNKEKCYPAGRGVIYLMKDEFGNECTYDFKSILFKRFKVESADDLVSWLRTSGYYISVKDRRLLPEDALNKMHYESYDGNDGGSTRFQWFYTFNCSETDPADATVYCANHKLNYVRDNKLGLLSQLTNVVNYSGTGVNQSLLNNNVFIGENFIGNICTSQGFIYNTFYGYYYDTESRTTKSGLIGYNTFGDNFAFNICRDRFQLNAFLNVTRYNVIDSNFNYNEVSNLFECNRVASGANYNKIGSGFNNNKLDSNFSKNTVGSGCINSTFLSHFEENNIGNTFTNGTISTPYLRRCQFADGLVSLSIEDSLNRSGADRWYLNFKFNTVYGTGLKPVDFGGTKFIGQNAEELDVPINSRHILVFENLPNSSVVLVWSLSALAYSYYNSTMSRLKDLEKKASDLLSNINSIRSWANNVTDMFKFLNSKLPQDQLMDESDIPTLKFNT